MKSLRVKFIIYIVPLIIFISLSFLFFFLNRANSLAERELTKVGFALAESLSHASELAVLSEDETFLEAPLKGIFKEKDVVSVVVYNQAGRIIASLKTTGIEERMSKDVLEEVLREGISLERIDYTKEGEKIHSFFAPIFISGIIVPQLENEPQRIIGLTKVGLSLKSIEAHVRKTFFMGLAMAVLMIFLGISGVFFLTGKITSPIKSVTEGAKAIGRGILDYRIKVKTGDEIEELAESFNRMAGRLAEISKKREKDLQELERTAKILVRRDLALSEANERLIAMDKAKSEFIAIAAHQLRTPLSGVKWTLKMMIDEDIGPLTEEQKEFLERGYQTNERMIHLVNDLLNVARIEEGRFAYKTEKTQLEDLIQDAIEMLSQEIKRKKLKFQFDRPEQKLPKIDLDPEKIQLSIENLLNNAVRYTPIAGKIKLIIKQEDNQLKVIFQDNGVGVPQEQQNRLFTKFFRGSNVVKIETEGTGLGLYIAKNIIEAHNGQIGFEPEENKGSVFWFSLPLR